MADQPLTQFVNDKNEPVAFVGDDDGTQEVEAENESGNAANDREKYVTLEVVAQQGWENHRSWERIIGEQPKLPWDDLPAARQEEIKAGVRWVLDNPHASVSAQHDYWRALRASKPILGAIGQNMVPFDQLPWSQQMKARLWRHVIHAIVG